MAFPIYLGVSVLAPELIVSLFGKQWIPATTAMQILAFEGIVLSASLFHKSVFVSMGKPALAVKINIVNAIANVIACLIAVRWGINTVAVAYVVSSYLVFPVSQSTVNILIDIETMPYLRQFVTPLLSSAIMVGAIAIFKHFLLNTVDPKLTVIIGTIVGMLVYALCIKIIEPQLFTQARLLIKSLFSKEKTSKNSI